MNFNKYISSFKREEIARCWVHMTAMTLTVARNANGKSLLVIEGAAHIDEDGNDSNDPIFLGEIKNEDRLKAVAFLLKNNRTDVSIEGQYSWTLVKHTTNKVEQHLWSVCWATSEYDHGKDLPEFLCKLTAEQIEAIVKYFPDASSHELIDLARFANQYFLFKDDAEIQAIFQNYILEDGHFAYDDFFDVISNDLG